MYTCISCNGNIPIHPNDASTMRISRYEFVPISSALIGIVVHVTQKNGTKQVPIEHVRLYVNAVERNALRTQLLDINHGTVTFMLVKSQIGGTVQVSVYYSKKEKLVNKWPDAAKYHWMK